MSTIAITDANNANADAAVTTALRPLAKCRITGKISEFDNRTALKFIGLLVEAITVAMPALDHCLQRLHVDPNDTSTEQDLGFFLRQTYHGFVAATRTTIKSPHSDIAITALHAKLAAIPKPADFHIQRAPEVSNPEDPQYLNPYLCRDGILIHAADVTRLIFDANAFAISAADIADPTTPIYDHILQIGAIIENTYRNASLFYISLADFLHFRHPACSPYNPFFRSVKPDYFPPLPTAPQFKHDKNAFLPQHPLLRRPDLFFPTEIHYRLDLLTFLLDTFIKNPDLIANHIAIWMHDEFVRAQRRNFLLPIIIAYPPN